MTVTASENKTLKVIRSPPCVTAVLPVASEAVKLAIVGALTTPKLKVCVAVRPAASVTATVTGAAAVAKVLVPDNTPALLNVKPTGKLLPLARL